MRKFLQNKLWRDKSVEILKSQGSRIDWRVLSDEEFNKELRLKLLEEAQEVAQAQNRSELISELADLFEVVDNLATIHGISYQEIHEVKSKKLLDRGGFAGRKFVAVAEHPRGSFGERYCLKDKEKYPEIF